MRRWWLLVVVLDVGFLAFLGFVGGVLAYQQPFPPGHPLYTTQDALGRWLMPYLPANLQAQVALRVLARHVDWMEQARNTPAEGEALMGFHQALVMSALALRRVSPEVRPLYQRAWARILERGQRVLTTYVEAPRVAPELWAQTQARVAQALALAQAQGLSTEALSAFAGVGVSGAGPRGMTVPASSSAPSPTPQPTPQALPDGTPTPLPHPRPIPFPTDFAARHTFFPLTGQHARLACTDCHQGNRFAGTPRSCMVCHQADRPQAHFEGECSLCHSSEGWLPAQFDHAAAGATDCLSCHRKDRPRNHFQGQCSLCHSTSAWKPAHFTHRFPLNHGGANGVCSTCHPSGTASYTCSACHRPAHMRAEHAEEGIYNIAGRCAVCHPTGREGGGYEREYEGGEDHDD